MVNLWHVKAQVNWVFDDVVPQPGGYATQNIHTEVDPLSVEFDMDHTMKADPSTFTASYSYNSSYKIQAGGLTPLSATSVPTGTWTYTSFVGARNIAICDESVKDPMAPDTEGSFLMAGTITVPVTITTTPSRNPPQSSSTGLGFQMLLAYSDYDTSTTHSTIIPPADPFPWAAVHAIFNDPNESGKLSFSTNTTGCTVTAGSLAMNYFPQNSDMRRAANSMTGEKGITINLARTQTGYFLHANNLLQPTVDGQDVSGDFYAWRWARVWKAPLGSDGSDRTGQYTSGVPVESTPDLPTTSSGWVFDNAPAEGVRDRGWADIPGGPSLGADPSAWPSVRQLDEFVASVYQYPEFGLIYYIVVYDVLPNACRVTMYPAQSITVDQWCQIKSSSAPYMAEGPIAGDPASTQTWQPPVASNAAASNVVTSGWTDPSGAPTLPGGVGAGSPAE